METTMSIPLSVVLTCLRDEEIFKRLMRKLDFREWAFSRKSLQEAMLRDDKISSNIKNYGDSLWNHFMTAYFDEPREAEERRPSTSPSYREDDSNDNGEGCVIEARSWKGKAMCKVGEADVSGALRATSLSEHGEAETNFDKLSIRDNGFKLPGRVTLAAESKMGNATNKVDTIVLGGNYTKTDGGFSQVKNGIAISGQSYFAKGIHVNDEELERNPSKAHKLYNRVRPTPRTTPLSSITDDEEQYLDAIDASRASPTRTEKTEEIQDTSSSKFFPEVFSKKNKNVVLGSHSSNGEAVYQAKTIDIEVQDVAQQVLAVAESKGNAKFSVDELRVKTVKPQPIHKTYKIQNVTGSVYVENDMTMNNSNCKDVKMADTTIGSHVPAQSKATPSSAANKSAGSTSKKPETTGSQDTKPQDFQTKTPCI